MSWEDRRTAGAAVTALRHDAHSDDAKNRSDDSTHLRPRARWVAPAMIAGAVLLVGGGGATAALVSTHSRGGPASDHPASSTTSHTAATRGSAPPSTSPASTSDSPTVSGPLEFDTKGTMRYVVSNGSASSRRPAKVAMHVDCTSGSCVIDAIGGYLLPGIAGRPLARSGPDSWSAGGRTPRPGCGAHADEGLASVKLHLTPHEVELVVHRNGSKGREGKCYSIYNVVDGTFTGPRA